MPDARIAKLLLVRHCQAAQSADNESRPLSELGLEQARRLGDWLGANWQVDGIISSPYRRTIDTIAPFATAAALVITLDDRLREREAPFRPVAAEHIAAAEACFADHSLRLDSEETGFEAQQRGWQAIEDALRSSLSLPVLVSHGQLLSFALARIDGTSGAERWRTMTTPDVFLLEQAEAGVWRVERVWES